MVIDTQWDLKTSESIQQIDNEIAVRFIMSTDVFVRDIESTAFDIAHEMINTNVDSIIITRGTKAKGIITEKDLVRKVMALDKRASDVKAKDIMSCPIITVKPSTSVIEASEIMVKARIRRLVVMEDDNVMGVISDRDILTISPSLNTILENLIEINKAENQPDTIEVERGICQNCGSYVDNLTFIDGLMICEDCKEEQGYYD